MVAPADQLDDKKRKQGGAVVVEGRENGVKNEGQSATASNDGQRGLIALCCELRDEFDEGGGLLDEEGVQESEHAVVDVLDDSAMKRVHTDRHHELNVWCEVGMGRRFAREEVRHQFQTLLHRLPVAHHADGARSYEVRAVQWECLRFRGGLSRRPPCRRCSCCSR